MIRAAALWLAALLCGTAPAEAAIHALVMGFDTYRFKISLEGSRNDAADLAKVLRRHGVEDLTMLDEHSGRRSDFEAAWAAMMNRSASGDLVFMSFSGHGNRSPEPGEPKHTPDGMEKGFLLPAYDEAKFPEEQLRFEHLYDLFDDASKKGVKVVFVADACHAGGTVRAVRASSVVPKFQTFQTHGQKLPDPPLAGAVVSRPPISNLTIFSAADEQQSIQEFTIEGQRRGALSYVVARGLDGAAAANDGRLTAGALARYVLTNVRLKSENTQVPGTVTPEPNLSILQSAAPPDAAGMPGLSTTSVFVDGASSSLLGAVLVQRQSAAVLSLIGNRIFDAHGDAITGPVSASGLQDAVDARRVLDALTKVVGAADRGLQTKVAALGQGASDRTYVQGERVRIEAEQSQLPFLTVVDLAADGTIQFLWPHDGDPIAWTEPEPPHFDVQVTPPFGQDTLIFIESDKALPDLHAALKLFDGRAKPTAFYDALRIWLPQTRFRLGLQAVFTCVAVRSDGTCA
ncbi:caspase family protein [Lichenifustis flavocetrariae]|uniref:Caspase family protein n=1 Tax=Lichenifustis flavocetrariae TaxID=2949735 RepID=A0AA42CKK4_9HYPH|nr:caspase family protein [Lichenifustis flavocetrariae]MCW6509361.1 caspase family protein [Lichenifustis flavocetrariae]